ncbi:unnamed protein product [Discosporangium mesarthrocarpum]
MKDGTGVYLHPAENNPKPPRAQNNDSSPSTCSLLLWLGLGRSATGCGLTVRFVASISRELSVGMYFNTLASLVLSAGTEPAHSEFVISSASILSPSWQFSGKLRLPLQSFHSEKGRGNGVTIRRDKDVDDTL